MYVLHNGLPIIILNVNLKIYQDLFFAYLSSLPNLVGELMDNQVMESIKLSENIIVFKPLKNGTSCMVILADNSDRDDVLKKIINRLVDEFDNRYDLSTWHHDHDMMERKI